MKDKLSDLDFEYESRITPSTHAEREEVEEIDGQTGVPILIDGKHGVERVPKGGDIVGYLEETYGSAV